MADLSYWVEATARLEGNSGIQRVTRHLATGLEAGGYGLDYLVWSEARGAPIRCPGSLRRKLARWGGPPPPGWWGWFGQRFSPSSTDEMRGANGWLIVPEVPYYDTRGKGARTRADLAPALIEQVHRAGGKVAFIFYDLIPISMTGYEDLRAPHEAYLRHLLGSDLILPISQHSGHELRRYFNKQLGIPPGAGPTIRPIPLAHEFVGCARQSSPTEDEPGPVQVTCVGSVEPRKNHAKLLRAFNTLCAEHPDLGARLTLVGHVFPQCREEITALARGNPRIEITADTPDDEMIARVRRSHFTVFPSIEEGFGMPIAESLWLGKPCLCAEFGAMAEIARDGGCLAIDVRSENDIKEGLTALLFDRSLRRRLADEASTRPLKTWRDYATEVAGVLKVQS